MQLHRLWEQSYALFLGYPLFIQIALVMILISVLLFLLANASLSFNRFRTAYLARWTEAASKLINIELTQNLIMNDVVSEQDIDTIADRLRQITIKNNLAEQVTLDHIIFYHRNFTDQTRILLSKLFAKLNLVDNAVKKVKRKRWDKKAQGMKEIQEMAAGGCIELSVDALLNDENPDLRIEAQATYMRLNKVDPFGFLANATRELLDWHQILLYELISNTPGLPTPDTDLYLSARNVSVVSFSIKLMVYYQILESIPKLISLVDHPVQRIREEAVSALGMLNVEEAEAALIAKFPYAGLKMQLKILTSIGEIGSGRQLQFLEDQFLHAKEFSVIKTAACALATYPEFDKQSTLQEIDGDLLLHETIINHCTNPLIRN